MKLNSETGVARPLFAQPIRQWTKLGALGGDTQRTAEAPWPKHLAAWGT